LPAPPALPGEEAPPLVPPAPSPGPYSVTPLRPTLFPAAPGLGWYVLPSATVSLVFDDNIDVTKSGKKADFITRLAPSFALGFTSPRLNFQVGGSSSADIYAEHSDNDQIFRSQQVTSSLSYIVMPQATLGLNADYTREQSDTNIVNEFGVRV